MKTKTRVVAWIAVAALVLAICFFVWPTPYTYGQAAGTTTRTNRLSGVIEYASSYGWTKEQPKPEPKEESVSDLAKEL